jgi:hypothetical protein
MIIYRRLIILLLLAISMVGCLKSEIIPPDPLTKNILFAVDNIVTKEDVLSALAQIDFTTAQGSYPLKAVLIVKKPMYLRLELLPVVGTPDFFLTATPLEIKILLPSKAEFYHGKPTSVNLAQFLPWKFDIAEIVAILLCTYPPFAGEEVSSRTNLEKDIQRIEMIAQSGKSQTILLGKNGRLIKIVRRDEFGAELYTVLYEDYKKELPIAGKITINMAGGMTSFTLIYTDPKIEKNNDISIFDLPEPAGFTSIKLD